MLAKLKLVTKPSREFNPRATLATKWTKLLPNNYPHEMCIFCVRKQMSAASV